MDRSALRDQDVQATADDALVSKLSAAKLGYFSDPYLGYFVRKNTRRSPLINRGYYARVAAVQKVLQEFLAAGDQASPKQIISLGAGYDTSYFRLKAAGAKCTKYFEVDFPDVCKRKSGLILKHSMPLLSIIEGMSPADAAVAVAAATAAADEQRSQAAGKLSLGVASPSSPASAAESAPAPAADKSPSAAPVAAAGSDCIYLQSSDYALLHADLRDIEQLERNLRLAGIDFDVPTMLFSECVLVYMKGEDSGRVIEWAARSFVKGGCVMATYEQIRPDDAFGRTMLANLESRGCPLLGLRSHPTLESQQARFLSRGWSVARALDMNDVYRRYLPAADVKRIERLELWDEFEEWNMIQAHYCIAMACRHGEGPGASNYLSKVGYLDFDVEAAAAAFD